MELLDSSNRYWWPHRLCHIWMSLKLVLFSNIGMCRSREKCLWVENLCIAVTGWPNWLLALEKVWRHRCFPWKNADLEWFFCSNISNSEAALISYFPRTHVFNASFLFLQFNTDSRQRTETNSSLLPYPFAQGDFEGRLDWDARRGKTAFGQCILVFTRLGQWVASGKRGWTKRTEFDTEDAVRQCEKQGHQWEFGETEGQKGMNYSNIW